jgi:hypothetical protein
VQNGVVIGAYSFGTDGKDDRGDRAKDRQFLLFGPWIPPSEAAPQPVSSEQIFR